MSREQSRTRTQISKKSDDQVGRQARLLPTEAERGARDVGAPSARCQIFDFKSLLFQNKFEQRSIAAIIYYFGDFLWKNQNFLTAFWEKFLYHKFFYNKGLNQRTF